MFRIIQKQLFSKSAITTAINHNYNKILKYYRSSNKLQLYSRSIPRLILTSSLITSLAIYYYKYQMIDDKQLQKVRTQLQIQIKNQRRKYGQMTTYPEIKYNIRGNTYTIQFQIDQRKCNIFILISLFFNGYQEKAKGFRILDMKTMVKDDVITLYVDFEEQDPKWKTPQKGRLTITGIKTSQRPNFRMIFQKDDCVTDNNIKSLISSYQQAIRPRQNSQYAPGMSSSSTNTNNTNSKNKNAPKKHVNQIYKKLEEFGVTVFDPSDKSVELDWNYLAGYQKQKRSIQDTVLLALTYPEIYDEITLQTRVKNQPNRPKAVLFEGPPGTGKTTSAKIISQQVNIPLVYIPIQSIMSQFYGKSQQKLAEMWQMCKKLGKVIIFIDQIDALAGDRSNDMHQASRRILSTLLRKIDSFQSTTDVLLICATNRKKDIDPAMLSRIDLSIAFSLPDRQSRTAIFQRYAKHLSEKQREMLAQKTQGFSGRNISDICKHAERKWASKLIRKQEQNRIPQIQQYIRSLEERRQNQLN